MVAYQLCGYAVKNDIKEDGWFVVEGKEVRYELFSSHKKKQIHPKTKQTQGNPATKQDRPGISASRLTYSFYQLDQWVM